MASMPIEAMLIHVSPTSLSILNDVEEHQWRVQTVAMLLVVPLWFALLCMRSHSNEYLVMPAKSILRSERSSHISTPPETTSGCLLLTSSHQTNLPQANAVSEPSTTPLASFNDPTSDEEDEATMDCVIRSLDESEHARRMAAITSKERGDRYKQRYHSAKKQIPDPRFEKAEAMRELDERQSLAAMSKEQEKIDGLSRPKGTRRLVGNAIRASSKKL